jgi:hypothetical protein
MYRYVVIGIHTKRQNVSKFDGNKLCENQPRGSIFTMSTEDEQAFLTNVLFKEKNAVHGVWLRIEKTNGTLKWAVGHNVTNGLWAVPSPTNMTVCTDDKRELLIG